MASAGSSRRLTRNRAGRTNKSDRNRPANAHPDPHLRQHKRGVAQPEQGLDHVAARGEEERPKQDQEVAGSNRTQRGLDNFEFLTNSIFESNVSLREAWLGSSEAGA